MKRSLLLLDALSVGGGGGSAPAAAPAAPAAGPGSAAAPAAPSAAPAGGTPAPAVSPESDDPFEPPKKKAPPSPPTKPGEPPTASAPAPAPAPVDEDNPSPKELREIAKARKVELAANAGKIKELEAKIKSFEDRGLDTTALTNRLTAIEKERDEARAELRAAKHEASDTFKEKWDKPFSVAAERAKKQVTELNVTDAETGDSRPATWADFATLYQLPTGKAIEQANALFGASASYVLQQRERLLELDDARKSALEDERKHFKARDEQERAEKIKEGETVLSTWRVTNSRLAETVADYKDDPTDTEASEARKHALSVFDAKIEAADRGDYIKKKLLRDAHIRMKVGTVPVLKLKLSRAEAKIADLQKQVDALKGSDPRRTSRPGGGDATLPEDDAEWGKGLREHATG